jgi:hypothetical protein
VLLLLVLWPATATASVAVTSEMHASWLHSHKHTAAAAWPVSCHTHACPAAAFTSALTSLGAGASQKAAGESSISISRNSRAMGFWHKVAHLQGCRQLHCSQSTEHLRTWVDVYITQWVQSAD